MESAPLSGELTSCSVFLNPLGPGLSTKNVWAQVVGRVACRAWKKFLKIAQVTLPAHPSAASGFRMRERPGDLLFDYSVLLRVCGNG